MGQAVMVLKGTVDYLVDNVFNYPTLAECYEVRPSTGSTSSGASNASPQLRYGSLLSNRGPLYVSGKFPTGHAVWFPATPCACPFRSGPAYPIPEWEPARRDSRFRARGQSNRNSATGVLRSRGHRNPEALDGDYEGGLAAGHRTIGNHLRKFQGPR